MSNEAPPSIEEVRARVLRSLAQCDFLPPDTTPRIEDAVTSALAALEEEQKEQARREHRATAKKWYWNQRKAIKEQLDRMARSSIVLTPPTITFRDFEACLCLHGRNWDYCESLGQSLISLRKAAPDASGGYWLRQLRKEQINPNTARLGEDVCTPGTRDRGPPSPRPAPPNGRPIKMVERTLLEKIVPCLKQAGWTYVETCDFLARLLIEGFGRKTESRLTLAYNLDRQRRYLHGSKSLT